MIVLDARQLRTPSVCRRMPVRCSSERAPEAPAPKCLVARLSAICGDADLGSAKLSGDREFLDGLARVIWRGESAQAKWSWNALELRCTSLKPAWTSHPLGHTLPSCWRFRVVSRSNSTCTISRVTRKLVACKPVSAAGKSSRPRAAASSRMPKVPRVRRARDRATCRPCRSSINRTSAPVAYARRMACRSPAPKRNNPESFSAWGGRRSNHGGG